MLVTSVLCNELSLCEFASAESASSKPAALVAGRAGRTNSGSGTCGSRRTTSCGGGAVARAADSKFLAVVLGTTLSDLFRYFST